MLRHKTLIQLLSFSWYIDVNECLNNPCTNTGEAGCVNTVGGYYCTCDVEHLSINGVCQGKLKM